MTVEFNEYKGNKMIILNGEGETNSKWPFQFGKSKARLIVANIEEIKKFADEE